MLDDFEATTRQELTVQKGQTVEIVERIESHPDWCIVRALGQDNASSIEGLVPISVLSTSDFGTYLSCGMS